MNSEHSRVSKISFIFFVATLVFFIFAMADTSMSKYSYFVNLEYFGKIGTINAICFAITLIGCIITGFIGVFEKNTIKILPTISLSVIFFGIFFLLLTQLELSLLVFNIERGVVTNFGIFEIPTETLHNGKTKNLYAHRVLIKNTGVIPAELGTRFGLNFVLPGEPKGEIVKIMKVTKYPEGGLQKANKIILADTSFFSVKLNALRYSGFAFENENELIPGLWEFQYWYQDQKLFEKEFNIILESAPFTSP